MLMRSQIGKKKKKIVQVSDITVLEREKTQKHNKYNM